MLDTPERLAARHLRNYANTALNIGGWTYSHITEILSLATALDGQQPDERFADLSARIAAREEVMKCPRCCRDNLREQTLRISQRSTIVYKCSNCDLNFSVSTPPDTAAPQTRETPTLKAPDRDGGGE